MVESTAKLQESIKAMTGVDILEADGQTFKSTYQIIKELADVWGGLSDINQASLLEMIAGKRQSNIVAATLNNMADLEKSMSVTTNAEGSAMTEHERWMQSIEASEAKAQAAVEEFSNAFMSSSLVKFSYDASTGILGFLTKITEAVGALPTALAGLSGIASMFGKGLLQKNSLMGKYTLFGANTLATSKVDYSTLGQIGTIMSGMNASDTDVTSAYKNALANAGLSVDSFNKSTQKVIKNVLQQNSTVGDAASSMTAYSIAMKTGTTVGAKFATTIKAIGASLASMAIVGIISTGIGWLIQQVNDADKSFGTLTENLERTKTEYSDSQSEIESINTELTETNSQIESLQGKLSTTGLTFVEQSELSRLQAVTSELEAQKAILEGKSSAQQAQINSDFVSVVQNARTEKTKKGTALEDSAQVVQDTADWVANAYSAIGLGNFYDHSAWALTEEENFKINVSAYKNTADAISNMQAQIIAEQQKGDEANQEWIASSEEALAAAKAAQSERLSEISSFALDVTTAAEGVTRTSETAEYLDWATDIAAKSEEAMVYAKESNLSGIFDVLWGSSKHSTAVNELKELAKAGELTIDTLSNTGAIRSFFSELEDYGISTQEAIDYINSSYETLSTTVTGSSISSQYGTFDSLSTSLYNTTDAYTALKSAIDEQAKSGYLSVDTYKELIAKNADFASYLELTAGGWRLNTEAVNEYMEAQDATTRMNALAAIIDLDEQIADARENLVNLSGDELDAANANIDSMENERNQLAMLVTSLDKASGAYQRYLEAKETADSSDMYDAATDMYDDYKDARKSGRTGTDQFQASTAFIMGEDWESATDGTQESRDAVYKEAEKKYKRYFGQESEINGAVNFLKDVQEADASLVSGNATDGYLINAGVSMEQLAEAAGVSVDAVDSLIGLMEAHEIDFGREFDIPDETVQSVEEYTDTLETAEKLREKAAEKRTEAEKVEAEGGDSSELVAQAEKLESAATSVETAADTLSGTEPALDTLSVEELQAKVTELSAAIQTLNETGIDVPVALSNQYEEASTFLAILQGSSSSPVNVPVSETGAEETQTAIEGVANNSNAGYSTDIDVTASNAQTVGAEIDEIAKDRTATITVNQEGVHELTLVPKEEEQPIAEDNLLNKHELELVPKETTIRPYKEHELTLDPDQRSQSGITEHELTLIPKDSGQFDDDNVSNINEANSEMSELADNAEKFSDAVSSADKSMGDVSTESEEVTFNDDDMQNVRGSYEELASIAQKASQALYDSGDHAGASKINQQVDGVTRAASELETAYANLKNTDPADTDAYATASDGLKTAAANYSTAYSTLQSTLSGLQTVNVTANTSQAISKINALSRRTVTITVKANTSGISLPGNARGTSNAQAGISLVDEEGAELIEHTSQGTFELGTNKGARLTNLNKGDVVHTASETKSILKRLGLKIGGSFKNGLNAAKSVLTGGAFAIGKVGGVALKLKAKQKLNQSNPVKNKSSSSSKKKSSSSSSSSSNSAIKNWEDYLDQLFDWVEVKLERLEQSTNRWTSAAAEAIGYTLRNAQLENALSSTSDQIDANTAAYTKYMEQADEVATKLALEEDIINKIKDGSIEIASYDEDMQNKISAYKEWYDKAIECKDALYDLREQERELAEEKLDNILDHYQYRIDRLDAIVDYSDSLIDLKNDTGAEVLASDYDKAIVATTQKIKELYSSREAMASEFASLVERGLIQEGSEAWNDYTGELEELDETIVETKSDLQELNDAVSQINVTNLEYAMTALEAAAEKIQGMMALHESQGLDNTSTDYESLIQNGMKQIDNLEKQNEEYKKQQEGLDVLSEKYQELQDNIDKNNQSILDMKESQEEWNDAVVDLRIAEIQDYQDELQKANDKLERQKDLEQAIEDLQKARTQRTQRIYREGVGLVYESDKDAVKSAQDNLDSVIHNEVVSKMDDIIDALEDYKDDTNVYDAMGNLLGTAYSLPSISDYSDLLNLSSGNSIITEAMQAAKDAAYQQVMSSVANATNNVTIGDITVQGVDDANGLAEAIVDQLGNAVLQEMYSRT